MYIYLVLLSALLLGVYEIFKKISLKQSNIYEVLFFYCISGFIVSLFLTGNSLNFNFYNSLLVLVKSIILVFNWLLVAKCMSKLDVSIVVTFGLINSALVVLSSFLLFKETLSLVHIVGFVLIFIGVLCISFIGKKENIKSNEKYGKYIFYLVLASLLSVVSTLFDKYLIDVKRMNSKEILFFVMFFNSIIYGVIYFVKCKKIDIGKLKSNYFMILTGAFLVISDFAYYNSIALEGSKLSTISVLRKCSVIVATVLSSLFLKEKNIIKKLSIIAIMLCGVYLIVINE